MLSSDRYIHFFSLLFFFFSPEADDHIISLNTYIKSIPSNINRKTFDLRSVFTFQLRFFLFYLIFLIFRFLLNRSTVYAHVKSLKAALKPRSAQFLLERPAPGARGREWIDTDCVCEIAAEASARREPKVRRGIIVQRLQRDWIGVKATQLAQREKKE